MKLPLKILTFTIAGSYLLTSATAAPSVYAGGASSVSADPITVAADVPAVTGTSKEIKLQTDFSVRIVKEGDETEDEPAYLVTGHGYRLLPLRDVAEKIGYTVKWDQETRSAEVRKGAAWTTVQKDTDYYLYNGRTPISLGIAPVIINDSIYVLQDFFSDVLQLSVELEQGTDVLFISQRQE
ncbi:MAG: copper amine oxidase N-terminal domain-containing protein [Bacillota bacterium]